MPSLNEILKDSTKYPDTTEYVLPDGTRTTIGEVRTEVRNTFIPKEDFTRGQQKAAAERAQLEQQYSNQLYQEQQRALALQQQLQARSGQSVQQDDLDAYVNDPTFAPIAKRLKTSLERSEALEKKLQQTERRIADHEQVWWLNQHATVLKGIQAKDPDMADQTKVNDFLNYAKNQGFSNLDTAYSLYTRDRDIERAKQTANAEAYERAKTELSAPRIPTGASQAGGTSVPANMPSSIDDAVKMALSDPEIGRMLDATPH